MLYDELRITPAVNASGKMTALGGSRLSESVTAAMTEAGTGHVVMADLLAAAGRDIARATGTEDACVTTGAAAGVAVAVAALVAGTDPARIEALPDALGHPDEVVLQKGHAVHFGAPVTQMVRLGGGRPVEVGAANKVTAAHLAAAVTPRTVALLYVQSHHAVQKGTVPLAEMIAVGREHGVPVIVDAAAEEDLRRWPATGADLVVYSGGKAIGGPTSGIICGSAALVAACRAQSGGIARPMKVGKETVLGLVRAVRDHAARAAGQPAEGGAQQTRMAALADRLGALPGLTARVVQDDAGRDIHRTEITVDPGGAGLTAVELARSLAAGSPPVFLRDHHAASGRLAVDPRPLDPAEEQQLERRIAEVLAAASGDGAPGAGQPAAGTGTDGSAGGCERRLLVTEPAGLHARPAAAFAQAAARGGVKVVVHRADDGRSAAAHSVLGLMSLNIRRGEEIVLRVEGEAGEAARHLLDELGAIAAPGTD
ncbi:DgaE family pyridoxal phosphate-dependent ammonia lyase [Streptomyces sp. NPDC059740]|uniref:DgaE family pyridoxal phosphate-dependent ammonia lyase n=1 Tax=Streptomyces sp. NPDC059740 TaxID=3346926 RepID=UPI00364B2290